MNPETNELVLEENKPTKPYKPRREPENLCPWCRLRYERRKRKTSKQYYANIEFKDVIIDWN